MKWDQVSNTKKTKWESRMDWIQSKSRIRIGTQVKIRISAKSGIWIRNQVKNVIWTRIKVQSGKIGIRVEMKSWIWNRIRVFFMWDPDPNQCEK